MKLTPQRGGKKIVCGEKKLGVQKKKALVLVLHQITCLWGKEIGGTKKESTGFSSAPNTRETYGVHYMRL